MICSFLRLLCLILVCVSRCRQPKQDSVIMCNGHEINDIKLSFIITARRFSYRTTPCVVLSLTSAHLVCDLFYFPRLPHPLLINSWTTGLGAHLPLSFTRSRPGGTLTPPQAYIFPGVACATRWLIPYFQVWHARHLLAHPALVGCVATSPIIMYLFTGCTQQP